VWTTLGLLSEAHGIIYSYKSTKNHMKNPFKKLVQMANPAAESATKILIVEDEEILRNVLKDRLLEEGWGVEIAEDGERALDMIMKTKYNVVLLDLLLPKKSGFEVLEQIKDDPELREMKIIVIVLSNLGGDDDIKKALGLGAVDYFVKTQHPIAEVIDKIKKYK
jgi:DNA-binding response OmpR family regulator